MCSIQCILFFGDRPSRVAPGNPLLYDVTGACLKIGVKSIKILPDGARFVSWFALASYQTPKGVRTGLVVNGELFDLSELYERHFGAAPPWGEAGVEAILRDWAGAWQRLEALEPGPSTPVPDGLARLAPPFRPSRIYAAASNYVEHADEMGTVLATKSESNPYIFIKAASSIVGPNETVLLPKESSKVDWEVELAVVIGRAGRRIPQDRALDHVAGYTILNDISARDLTRRKRLPLQVRLVSGEELRYLRSVRSVDRSECLYLRSSESRYAPVGE